MKRMNLPRLAGVGLAALLAGAVAAPGVAEAASAAVPPLDPALLSAAIDGLPNADVTGALVRVRGSATR